MDTALYISMNGAKRSLAEQHVYSNNLANVNTTGFRQDLYQSESLYLNGNNLPSQVFTTSKASATDFKQGPLMTTGRELDVAIRGEGWLAVQTESGQTALTRAGNLQINQSGFLVTQAGDFVLGEGGPISIPPYESLQIAEDGTITVVPQGEDPTAVTVLDRLMLVKPEPKNLVKGGDGLMHVMGDSTVQADAQVRVAPKTLEGSNVSAVEQMVNMINASREFEVQLKLMGNIDQNQQSLARLLQI